MDIQLTDSQKQYIKDNLSTRSPEEMAEYLDVTLDRVNEYIVHEHEPFSSFANAFGGLAISEPIEVEVNKNHKITFTMDENGQMAVEMAFPTNLDNIDEFIGSCADFLFVVSSGQLKPMVAAALADLAFKSNMGGVVKRVVEKWQEREKEINKQPCIQPRNVFI